MKEEEFLNRIISVIMPFFNSSNYLEDAVYSVLDLSEVGELILIDDGSTDDSYHKCLKFCELDSRVSLYFHPNHLNEGVSKSRNLGIKMAKLPYIAFLDSDDFYLPNRFQQSISLLLDSPELDACFGFVKKIEIDTKKEQLFGFNNMKGSESVLTYLLMGGYFHTNSVLIRKSFLDRIGYFDSTLVVHEDVELWIRMACFGNIKPIMEKDPIAIYNYQGASLIHSANSATKLLLWKKVFKKIFFYPIGFKNRYLIVRQLMKVVLKY